MVLLLSIQCMADFMPHKFYALALLPSYHVSSKIQNKAMGNDHLGMKGLCCQLQIWKEYLDPRISTDPRTVVGPLSTDNLPHEADGYFMGYSNIIHLLLYYDTHTDRLKIIHHSYVDEHDILIHPKTLFKTGSLLLHEYTLENMYQIALLHPKSN